MQLQRIIPQYDAGGAVEQVRLSADGSRMGFVVRGDGCDGLYAGSVDGDDWLKIAGFPEWHTPLWAWSAEGSYLAYAVPGDPLGVGDHVCCVETARRNEVAWLPGHAFAWSRRGALLYLADMASMQLVRCDVAAGRRKPLVPYHHHASERFRSAVVPSPDGQRLVLTSRNELQDVSRVMVIARHEGKVASEQLSWIPGADQHVRPCWSPKGRSLALWMVHEALDRTGLVLLEGLQGDGEIYYQRDGLDEAIAPVWAPDGRSLFFMAEGGQLTRLDLDRRVTTPLGAPGLQGDTLRLLPDGRLLVEGGTAVRACVLAPVG